MPTDYMADFIAERNRANAANEARYAQINQGYDAQQAMYGRQGEMINAGYASLLKRQEKIGDSQRLSLQDQYLRNLGKAQSSLRSRGLSNSTIMNSASRGEERNYQRGQIDLSDSLAREYAGVRGSQLGYQADYQRGLAGLKGSKLQFMERRSDQGPDLAMYANLARMQGMASGGPPGGQGGFVSGGFGAGSRGGGFPPSYGSVTRGNGDGTYTTFGPGGVSTGYGSPQQPLTFGGGGFDYGYNPWGDAQKQKNLYPTTAWDGTYGAMPRGEVYGQGGGYWGDYYGSGTSNSGVFSNPYGGD